MVHLTALTVAGAGASSTTSLSVIIVLLPLAAPMVAAVVAALTPLGRLAGARASVGAAAVVLGSGVAAAVVTLTGAGGAEDDLVVLPLLRIDALSAVMLIVIGTVGLIATSASVDYLRQELDSEDANRRRVWVYTVLLPVFLTAMVLVVISDNLGLLWAGIEATTIVTAFLIGHRRTRGSVEATWKYVIICAVGIILAYLGTVLVHYAARQAGLPEADALNWTQLSANAEALDPGVMRLAFALLVLGFGAKAGMAPLHSWLPDTYSQAPAPVAALMSGALSPVAVYALLRYRVIAAPSIGEDQVRLLLLVVAFASLTLAASLIIGQRDYKRLLAYSSIEHMALAMIALAVGTRLAVAALLLHLVGHGVAKAVLFCAAGRIQQAEGSSSLGAVRGLLSRQPALGAVFATGIAALLGLPPFSLFASEVGLARAGTAAGMGWVMAAALAMAAVIFVAFTVHLTPMLVGAGSRDETVAATPSATALSPLILGLVALAALGVFAWPLNRLLHEASMTGGTW